MKPEPRSDDSLDITPQPVPISTDINLLVSTHSHGDIAPKPLPPRLKPLRRGIERSCILCKCRSFLHGSRFNSFPLFHWPSFKRDVLQLRYTTDQAFYVVTMVVCAIVSARLRDGAVLPASLSESSSSMSTVPSSEDFYQLAVDAFPPNLSNARGFDYKRAKALMAILSVQYGDVANLHTHMGDYVTLTLNDSWYDEGRWPGFLTPIQIEEWRRLVRLRPRKS